MGLILASGCSLALGKLWALLFQNQSTPMIPLAGSHIRELAGALSGVLPCLGPGEDSSGQALGSPSNGDPVESTPSSVLSEPTPAQLQVLKDVL